MTAFDKWFNNLAMTHPYWTATVAVILQGGLFFLMLPLAWWFLLPMAATWLLLAWCLKLAKKQP